MSEQNTGGDGSVRWTLDADNVTESECKNLGGGKHTQNGIDKSGDAGDWFTVSIEVPEEFDDAEAYLVALKEGDQNLLWGVKKDVSDNDRIYFNVRIERKNHDQIRVSWGESENVRRPRKAV